MFHENRLANRTSVRGFRAKKYIFVNQIAYLKYKTLLEEYYLAFETRTRIEMRVAGMALAV
jgi:hypothetical protein